MDNNGPDEGVTSKVPLAVPPTVGERAAFAWPWGLVAVGIMALAWVGIYLIWNGVVFVLGL